MLGRPTLVGIGLGSGKEPAEFQFGFMRVPGGQSVPETTASRRSGDSQTDAHRRIFDIVPVDPGTDSLFKVPFVIWQGTDAFPH